MVCNHVGDFYDGLRTSAWAFNKFKKRTFLTRFDTAARHGLLSHVLRSKLGAQSPGQTNVVGP